MMITSFGAPIPPSPSSVSQRQPARQPTRQGVQTHPGQRSLSSPFSLTPPSQDVFFSGKSSEKKKASERQSRLRKEEDFKALQARCKELKIDLDTLQPERRLLPPLLHPIKSKAERQTRHNLSERNRRERKVEFIKNMQTAIAEAESKLTENKPAGHSSPKAATPEQQGNPFVFDDEQTLGDDFWDSIFQDGPETDMTFMEEPHPEAMHHSPGSPFFQMTNPLMSLPIPPLTPLFECPPAVVPLHHAHSEMELYPPVAGDSFFGNLVDRLWPDHGLKTPDWEKDNESLWR